MPEYHVIDAFTDRPLAGNPAAVLVLGDSYDDAWAQGVAAEFNLSETAFARPVDGPDADYELRWFTPTVEIDLCGHATLAAAYVLFEFLGYAGDTIRFRSRSGPLVVTRSADGLLTEQLALILGEGFVLTFQEQPGDCFDPVRERLRKATLAGGRDPYRLFRRTIAAELVVAPQNDALPHVGERAALPGDEHLERFVELLPLEVVAMRPEVLPRSGKGHLTGPSTLRSKRGQPTAG
jgi:hypothetical protein